MTLTLMPTPTPKLPEPLADAHAEMLRDAHDHPDLPEYVAALHEIADCMRRLRQIAAPCMRPAVLNAVAESIGESLWPLEEETARWDADRDARIAGNRLDDSRACGPRDFGRT